MDPAARTPPMPPPPELAAEWRRRAAALLRRVAEQVGAIPRTLTPPDGAPTMVV